VKSMQLQYLLYLILLLTVSCNAKQSSESSNKSEPSKHENCLTDTKSKLQECVEQSDAGIEIICVTEQWAAKMGLMDLYQMDPGFSKWCVLFHDIPGNPPYSFQQKRLLQPLPDRYYPCQGPCSEDILKFKNRNKPTGLMVSARGYLPGEKVTIRLSAKDAYREITFYPRPLFMKKKTGELLVKATLLCAEPGNTLYELDICGLGKQEKCKLVSNSEGEILSFNLQGPMECTITPEVAGQKRGFAKTALHFEDGTSYSLDLPWGYALLEYKLGNK